MPDPTVWRERADEFRERARTTREAERQRLFPLLAAYCEHLAQTKQSNRGERREPPER